MHKYKVVLVVCAVSSALAATARAQTTAVYLLPPPATRLEILETNTGRLLIKASMLIGSTQIAGGTVSVTCKEDTDAPTGNKTYGIAVTMTTTTPGEEMSRAVVDYDEVAPLLNAIDALARMDSSVTTLPNFDAFYQTRGGFRVGAFGVRGTGAVEYSVRGGGMSKGLVLAADQWAQFRGLIDQAKRKLDELRAGK